MEFYRYGSPFILRFYQIHFTLFKSTAALGWEKMLKTKAKFDDNYFGCVGWLTNHSTV